MGKCISYIQELTCTYCVAFPCAGQTSSGDDELEEAEMLLDVRELAVRQGSDFWTHDLMKGKLFRLPPFLYPVCRALGIPEPETYTGFGLQENISA